MKARAFDGPIELYRHDIQEMQSVILINAVYLKAVIQMMKKGEREKKKSQDQLCTCSPISHRKK